jgi:starch phosphorylase
MSMTATRVSVPYLHCADIELPRQLEGLYDLAYNLWWSWTPQARRLFERIDAPAWEHYRNPVEMLINIEPSHWGLLLEDGSFAADYARVTEALESYLSRKTRTWFDREHGAQVKKGGALARGPVAYFSMEYGLHQCLAIYSGGLGVLSGDHCKSASDLGLPLVAVGLAYGNGYFQQTIDAEGLQQHFYPDYDFTRLPLRPAATRTGSELRVAIPLPGREVQARVWVAEVGRVPLLLLDTRLPENDPADRPITSQLYVRGRGMRLAQETVLGVGGVRALAALGIEPAVWHVNEGHSALLQLERLRLAVEAASGAQPLSSFVEQVQRDMVFTTHTPVPAGNEQFDRSLAEGALAPWSETFGGLDGLLALGDASNGESQPEPAAAFNLTALALRTSRWANAVSRLNAEVTNEMWAHLALPRAEGAAAIVPITNGIHTPTWVGDEMGELFERAVGSDWQTKLLDESAWAVIREVDDAEVWAAHQAQKDRLGRFVRRHLRHQLARHGSSPEELRQVDELFDEAALTIGFARRFATYKRAKLLFSDLDKLRAILAAADRPVQVLLAGKAHPADRAGQELIQQIFELSRTEELRGRVFFLEGYDMRIGRMLVQGTDVWLNTPRRPMEASGTSGQKAAMNGVLNCSILDGWWPEGYDGDNGWAIGDPEIDETLSEEEQDQQDADELYRLLSEEIVPAYYERGNGGPPAAWIARMKDSIATATPKFSSHRMVRDYFEQGYLVAP